MSMYAVFARAQAELTTGANAHFAKQPAGYASSVKGDMYAVSARGGPLMTLACRVMSAALSVGLTKTEGPLRWSDAMGLLYYRLP